MNLTELLTLSLPVALVTFKFVLLALAAIWAVNSLVGERTRLPGLQPIARPGSPRSRDC